MAISVGNPTASGGTTAARKPRLSFWQIWNMNFGFLGIQFGFALQNANVSRIFETLGANVDEIAILWIAAPTTGLLVQPVIGYLSDRTWHPVYGRRRPFFAIGAILASLALIIMPHSSVLWMAAGMLWILDASINISMEPFRAFVGDMLPDEQRTSGFAMQTFFIGVGAVVASFLPSILTNWFQMSNTAAAGEIPPTVQWSFYLGAIAFFSAVMWTVFKTREYPPEMMQRFNGEAQHQESETWTVILTDLVQMPATMRQLAVVQFFSWLALFAMWIYTTRAVSSHVFDMKLDKQNFALLKATLANQNPDREIHEQIKYLEGKYAQGDKPALSLQVIDYALDGRILPDAAILGKMQAQLSGAPTLVQSDIASAQKQLAQNPKAKINLQYTTIQYFAQPEVLAKTAWGDDLPKFKLITELKRAKQEYNAGADWVGVLFGVYNGLSALFAFFFPPFARATSRKLAHFLGLFCGGIGLMSIFFITNQWLLLLSMAGIGFAWASILSMPYAILAGALPPHKMGVYMGIFNFFIVIPQIVAAGLLGYILTAFFEGQAIYAMMVGGVSMLVAALLVFLVKDEMKET